MRVALSADEHGQLVDSLLRALPRGNHELKLFGTATTSKLGRGLVHAAAAREVVAGRADLAIVCSWSGTGAAIEASAVPGIRAAYCTDAETVRVARRWAKANVLALSLRLTSDAVMEEILDAWFNPPGADGGQPVGPATGGVSLSDSAQSTSNFLDHIVLDLDRRPWLRENIIIPLLRYDEVQGAALQDTLVVYCRSRFNLKRASLDLRVHANTVGYRMRQIRDVTGLDYQKIDDLMLLMLAARVIGGPEWQSRMPWTSGSEQPGE